MSDETTGAVIPCLECRTDFAPGDGPRGWVLCPACRGGQGSGLDRLAEVVGAYPPPTEVAPLSVYGQALAVLPELIAVARAARAGRHAVVFCADDIVRTVDALDAKLAEVL